MSEQNSTIHQAANDRSELSERDLDSVAGGTKVVDQASPTLSSYCCAGKHISTGLITVRK